MPSAENLRTILTKQVAAEPPRLRPKRSGFTVRRDKLQAVENSSITCKKEMGTALTALTGQFCVVTVELFSKDVIQLCSQWRDNEKMLLYI